MDVFKFASLEINNFSPEENKSDQAVSSHTNWCAYNFVEALI